MRFLAGLHCRQLRLSPTGGPSELSHKEGGCPMSNLLALSLIFELTRDAKSLALPNCPVHRLNKPQDAGESPQAEWQMEMLDARSCRQWQVNSCCKSYHATRAKDLAGIISLNLRYLLPIKWYQIPSLRVRKCEFREAHDLLTILWFVRGSHTAWCCSVTDLDFIN